MKKILFLLVVLGGFVGLGPFMSGNKAEVALDQWVVFMNRSGSYEARWDYYKKGWLSTDAVLLLKLKTEVDLPMGEALLQDWVLPLHIKMNHGPLLYKDNFRLGWFSGQLLLSSEHEGWIKEHVSVEGVGPFYTSNIYMDLKSDLHINDYSLPFSVDIDGETLSVEGYIGKGEMSLNQKVEYSGVFPSIQLNSDKGNLTIEGMDFTLSSDLAKKFGKFITPGFISLSVDSVKAVVEQKMMFLLSKAHSESVIAFNSNGADANISFNLEFNEFQSMDEVINNAGFTMSFDRMSLSFMDKYLAMVEEFGSIGSSGSAMMALQMSALATTDLFPAGPKFSISRLNFSTVDGYLDFTGDVAVSPDAASKMSNPLEIISAITMRAAMDVDKTLAQKLTKKSVLRELSNNMLMSGESMSEQELNKLAEEQSMMQLGLLVIQGMLIEKDEKYTAEFQFKNGAALLNGKAMPLPF